MFADISGFTAMSEKMDPEAVRDLINACFEHMVPVVERWEGAVDKFIGDEIMALFGAPVAHEKDPEHALRAALEMQQALATFNAEHDTDLGIHFGINTGLVIAGGVGSSGRQEYSVIGDAVNLAARLEDASERGEILVGLDTYRFTSHLFDFEAAGPIKLKGKVEPVAIYRLIGSRSTRVGMRATESRGISSPLVGREAEVLRLTGAFERLFAGQGGVVLITAEAGMGKSRLVSELRRQMAGTDLSWLEGRAFSFGQNISYWPFLEIIQADAGITIDDREAARWAKLEQRVSELFPEDAVELLPYLATLLSMEVPEELAERVKYLDGEAMGRQVFRGVRRLVARIAEERPLLLVFEDVHWLDQSSAALLEHLLPLVREVPLLICGVGRPDPETPAVRLRDDARQEYAASYTEIVLAPLAVAATEQLVRNLVPIDDLSARLRETILRKAEGNPFFVEEVIRALIDQGGLVRDKASGRWQVTARADEIAIPDTLHGVIMARIDRLDEEVKGVLKLAAVIGRSFFYRVLRSVAEAERQLDQRIEELQSLELVREKSRLPELEYIFKHALVQETTYEGILLQRRKELHKRVAGCIETLFADRLEEFSSILAYHYTRAEDWTKAQEYLFKAGDQAGRIAADAEALVHYEQAMAAYVRAFGDKWDPFERSVLERKVGEALYRRGNHEQAHEHLERALSILDIRYPASMLAARGQIATRITFGLKVARGFSSHYLRRLLIRMRRVPACRERQVAEEQCRMLTMLAQTDAFTDQERATLAMFLLLGIAEGSGLQERVATWYTAIGYAFSHVFLLPRIASHYLARGVALAEGTHQPFPIGFAYKALGIHEIRLLGEPHSALEHLRRAATVFWQAGDLRWWAMAVPPIAVALRYRGDLGEGGGLSRQMVDVVRGAGDRQALGWGLIGLGRNQDAAGAMDEATASLRQSIDLLASVPDYLFAVWASGFLGWCLLRQGKHEEALAVLGESRDLMRRFSYRGPYCVPVWTALAQASLCVAERAGESTRPAALAAARRACRQALREARYDHDEMPVAYRLQGTCEWLSGQAGAAHKWWQRALDLADKLHARYELGLTHLEIGKRMRDPAHLAQAESIFAEIGAQFDLAQARDAMSAL